MDLKAIISLPAHFRLLMLSTIDFNPAKLL
jgi:hypothetical protein